MLSFMRLSAVFVATLLWAAFASAQTTTLTPPVIKWGTGQPNSIAQPSLLLGYDGGIPCIVGSTPTCAIATASTGAGGTVAQGAPAVIGNAWPVTLVIGGALNAVGNPIFVAPGAGASFAVTAASLPLPTGAALDATLTTINSSLGTINTTLGTPMKQTGGTVGLVAGSALAGKFGIDQTTPGTTNAVAPTPITGIGSTTGPTITSTSGQALATGSRRFLYIGNESTTATIACNFGGTAIINTAGNYTIPPNAGRTWDGTFVPSEAVNCISSAATSPATIQVN